MVALFGATSRFREPYCIRRRSENVQLAHSGGRGDWWICKWAQVKTHETKVCTKQTNQLLSPKLESTSSMFHWTGSHRTNGDASSAGTDMTRHLTGRTCPAWCICSAHSPHLSLQASIFLKHLRLKSNSECKQSSLSYVKSESLAV